MKSQIREVLDRATKSLWRVRNHTSPLNGSSAITTYNIYRTWILSVVEYGSLCWIFVMKPRIGLDQPAANGYKTLFNQLDRMHNNTIKSCLGLKRCANGRAALVILGVMPIEYILAFRAAVWYYKIVHQMAGSNLHNQLNRLQSDPEQWSRTLYYSRCETFINQMSSYMPNTNLLSLPTLSAFKRSIKCAIFKELNKYWHSCNHSHLTRQLVTRWDPNRLSVRHLNRHAECMYNQILSGKDNFQRQWEQPIAWRCNQCQQTGAGSLVKHKFIECTHMRNQQMALKRELEFYQLEHNLQAIFSPKMSCHTQMFILSNFKCTPVNEHAKQADRDSTVDSISTNKQTV